MAAEIGGVIDAILVRQDEQHPEGGDGNALMQTGMAGLPGRGHGDDPDRGGHPPWRPRKCPRTTRRRGLHHRRRTLEQDVAELASTAGPGFNEAIHQPHQSHSEPSQAYDWEMAWSQ